MNSAAPKKTQGEVVLRQEGMLCKSGVRPHPTEESTIAFLFPVRVALAAAAAVGALLTPINPGLALDKLEYPPLRAVETPKYSKYRLKNGLLVYLMEDREVPLVGGTLLFRGGSRSDPEDKVGLATISASVLRSGGSTDLPGSTLDEFLAAKAAYVGASADGVSVNLAFSCLSEDLESVLPAFQNVVQSPLFPEEKLTLAKGQAFGAIARRNDDPNDIARREITKLVYGPSSPYARSIEYKTIASIDRDDLVSFYKSHAVPGNGTLAIVGDFQTEIMLAQIKTYFEDQWLSEENEYIADSFSVEDTDEDRLVGMRNVVYIADKPELSQSYIRAAELGGRLSDPHYFSLDVLNQILNGLGGRLFNELRSKDGLAYSVFGKWYPAFDHPGLFIAGGETSSNDGSQVVSFLNRLVDTLKSLDKSEVTAEELNYAKESTLNSFVFNFTSPEDVLARTVKYEFFDYPPNFAEIYRQGVEKVSAEQILSSSQQKVKEEDLVFLVVANRERVEPALKKAGFEVRVVDISIPYPATQ